MQYEFMPYDPEEIQRVMESLKNKDFDYDALNDKQSTSDSDPDTLNTSDKIVHANVINVNLGKESMQLITWRCHPRYRNHLYYKGEEFIAKSITWKYGRIAWRAGAGWPLYELPCPGGRRGGPGHNIVVEFGGRKFKPCSSTSSGTGKHGTSVYTYVYDDRYVDNTGFFDFIVSAFNT
ncbi:hypothetical protein ACFL2A_06585 [Thermodesulfobacteriota bacterium]